jgi:hypothetical protein
VRHTLYGTALDPPLPRLAQDSTGPPMVRPPPPPPPPRQKPCPARTRCTGSQTRSARPRRAAGPSRVQKAGRAPPGPGALPRALTPLAGSAAHNPHHSLGPSPSRRAQQSQQKRAPGSGGKGAGGQARLMKWQQTGRVRVIGPQKWHAPRVRAPRRGNGGRSGSVQGRPRLPGAQAAPAPGHRQTAHAPADIPSRQPTLLEPLPPRPRGAGEPFRAAALERPGRPDPS